MGACTSCRNEDNGKSVASRESRDDSIKLEELLRQYQDIMDLKRGSVSTVNAEVRLEGKLTLSALVRAG